MMFTRSYVRVIFLVVLAVLVLSMPNLFRESSNYIGEDPYFYIRIAELIESKDFSYDELSYSGRDFTYSLAQPLIFSFFRNFLPEGFVINVIPIILGLLSLLLFYLILKDFYVEPNVIYLSLMVLAISPPFIYIFSSYNKFTAITLVLLLTFYLFIKNNNLNLISYLLFLIIPFFGYQYSLLGLSIILIYCIKRHKMKKFFLAFFLSLTSLSLIYSPFLYKYGFSDSSCFDKTVKYGFLFSDLGSSFGISIFIIFLTFFGLSYLWKSKYRYLPIYSLLVLFIIIIIFNPTFIVYFNFILSLLAAFGFIYLIRSKWESETIRKLTMWILVIGLIFSTVTFIGEKSSEQPSKNLYDALDFLSVNTRLDEVVFSHYNYGVFINSITNKKNVMDSRFSFAPNLKERYQDSQDLFYTRDFNVTFSISNKYDIKYILITREMKEGLVWNEKDEGLLYLLNTFTDNYQRIYENEDVEIWRYRR